MTAVREVDVLTIAVTLALFASPVVAQHDARAHDTTHEVLPTGEPRSASSHGMTLRAGRWTATVHGYALLGATWAEGARGERSGFGTNMIGFTASRVAAHGLFGVRISGSAEPAMGRRGYPLLLQTGESADGLFPLRDRQHPHDLLTELAVAYRRSLPDELEGFAYLAAVGEPAFGPVPFMHRGSGFELPEPPLAHHVQDGTHVTHGVVRAGVIARKSVIIEGSFFNGRESDPNRWKPDAIRFDSYSFRTQVALGRNWALQGSAAFVAQPERTHPTINETRLSFSGTHNLPLPNGSWQTTLALGRSLTIPRTMSLTEAQAILPAPILAHYVSLADLTNLPTDSLYLTFPSRSMTGWLIESAVNVRRSTISARWERVAKSELFDPADRRHSQIYSVSKISLGYLWQVPLSGYVSLGIGGVGSFNFLPARLRDVYGGTPRSGQLFVRMRIHEM